MKILIAPLDWGLGHTTRCIPLIRYLQRQGHQVIAAAEGASAKLLQENFPDINILPLQGYGIRYSRHKAFFALRILLQVPKILSAIRSEQQWLLQHEQQFDLIISDNRYGLYHSAIPCCILTHQLQIKSGMGGFADSLLRRLHYRLLNRFTACWVVDEEGANGLSGDLAHPVVMPPRAVYIGWLSQLTGLPAAAATQPNQVLILLSGPEPMRGQLEQKVLEQIVSLTQYEFVLVAGNPLGEHLPVVPDHVIYHTHLPAATLVTSISTAALVICRSGYSTIMDLAVLGKRALLVPTPGQTEQEYLAQYLQDRNYFVFSAQHNLQLRTDIPKALSATLMPVKPSDVPDKIARAIDPFLRVTVPQQ